MTTSTSQNTTAPASASPRFGKLKRVLEELFQFDQAELDFGIYRIMNAKREEIRHFLDVDLLPQVQLELGKLAGGNRAELEQELAGTLKNAVSLGVPDPEALPKIQELRAKLAMTADLSAVEADIYNDLAGFFKRYYQNGDFLSLRRYKRDVYAIPYEGEEVKLHWANADQYYVKSSEAFRDYTFHLPATDGAEGRRVHFRITEADTEANNNKAENGKERRFIVADPPLEETNGELSVRFTYRVSGEKQAKLNADAANTILAQAGFDSWLTALKEPRPTEKNLKRTLLDKQLGDYTSKNSFDYFIHKDLRGFLRRELDFFIKNEVLQLDDLEAENEARALQQLARVKAMRGVAHKIIEMLAQLENFQKKIWLKKKFVVSTDYCVTLDKIIENAPELLETVAANEAQRGEWVRLFAIDETKGDALGTIPGYSGQLTKDFLEANPFLVLDTQFFDAAFKDKLLSSFDDLDAQTDGLLIKSENFQALNLLQARYKEQVKYIFIDPPYNTGLDGFPYKDNYQHSSWLSMMEGRMAQARHFLTQDGLFFATIDFVEVSRLRLLCDTIFGSSGFLADIAWEKRYTRSNNAKRFYSLKDTILCYRASEALDTVKEGRSEKSKTNYTNPDEDKRGVWISSSYINPATKAQRQNLVYPITNPFTGVEVEHPTHAWKYDIGTHKKHVEENRLYWGLDGSYEYPRLKSFLSEAKDGMVPTDVWGYKETGTTDDGGKTLKALFGSEVFDNPKPISLVRRALQLDNKEDSAATLDFFAGSGTTGHAVINLNREDGGSRKYILVEMGEYFDSVLKPRIQKVVYSKDWKDGKPVSREGSTQLVKVLRLESYEDALNNIEVRQPTTGQSALDFSGDAMKGFREDYLLHYMLDVETRDSASLLNFESFQNPFAYELKIATSSAGETRPTKVDLVETFN